MPKRLTLLLFGLYVLAALCAAGALVIGGVEDLLGGENMDMSAMKGDGHEVVSPAKSEERPQGESSRLGTQILVRNLFDSAVGPITGGSGTLALDRPENADDVVRVEACAARDMVLRTSVAYKENSANSIAVIEVSDRTLEVAEGDVVQGYSVVGIGWRYILLAGAGASELAHCYLDLYGQDDVVYLPVDHRRVQAVSDAASNDVEFESTGIAL